MMTQRKLVPGSQHIVTFLSLSAPAAPSLWNAWTWRPTHTHLQPQDCNDRELWDPGYPEHGSGDKALNGHISNQALGGKNSSSFLWDMELLSGVTLAQGFPWFWLQFPDSWAAVWGFPGQPILPLPFTGEICLILWVLCTSWAASPLSFTGVLHKSSPHLISSWYLLLEGPEP